jgi:hypothetical protein
LPAREPRCNFSIPGLITVILPAVGYSTSCSGAISW